MHSVNQPSTGRLDSDVNKQGTEQHKYGMRATAQNGRRNLLYHLPMVAHSMSEGYKRRVC